MANLRPAIPLQMPAVCTGCGNIFNTERGFFRYQLIPIGGNQYENLDGASIVSIEGTVGCPVCGGGANFRCDLFDFVDDIFADLKKLGKPQIIYLKELLARFSESPKNQSDLEALRAQSEKQGISIFGKFWQNNKDELNTLIGILSIVVTLILWGIDHNKKEQATIDNSVTIENVYQVALKQHPKEIINKSEKIIPRNQPCPCGSKKKFKHCCGKK